MTAPRVTIDVDGLLRRMARWTTILGIGSAIALGIWLGWEMALGVVLGAALGYANLWFAARTLRGILDKPQEHRPVPGSTWALPTGLLVKWPLFLLALFGILWYLPARPEGVALGVAIALAAASIAALPRANDPKGSTPS
jgi:hypothetical protein